MSAACLQANSPAPSGASRKRFSHILLVVMATLLLVQNSLVSEEKTADDGMVAIAAGAFRLDRYEVTNAAYAQFLNARDNQKEKGLRWIELGSKYALIEKRQGRFVPKEGFADHPVVEVSWYGARAYCQWAGKRLPSEKEWVQACGGPDELRFPWGEIYQSGRSNTFGDKDGYLRTAPVGSFPEGASVDGLMDMAGNVWEWTATDSADKAALRGGSWVNGNTMGRCTNRAADAAAHAYIKGNSMGFRCAR